MNLIQFTADPSESSDAAPSNDIDVHSYLDVELNLPNTNYEFFSEELIDAGML